MAHYARLRSRKIWALLGWLAYLMLAPLQLSANPLPGMALGNVAAAHPAQGASMPMPMGHLRMAACIQLQCHAAPTIGNHASNHDGRTAPPALALTTTSTWVWQKAPAHRMRTAPPPPLRPDPVRYARPARLLI